MRTKLITKQQPHHLPYFTHSHYPPLHIKQRSAQASYRMSFFIRNTTRINTTRLFRQSQTQSRASRGFRTSAVNMGVHNLFTYVTIPRHCSFLSPFAHFFLKWLTWVGLMLRDMRYLLGFRCEGSGTYFARVFLAEYWMPLRGPQKVEEWMERMLTLCFFCHIERPNLTPQSKTITSSSSMLSQPGAVLAKPLLLRLPSTSLFNTSSTSATLHCALWMPNHTKLIHMYDGMLTY